MSITVAIVFIILFISASVTSLVWNMKMMRKIPVEKLKGDITRIKISLVMFLFFTGFIICCLFYLPFDWIIFGLFISIVFPFVSFAELLIVKSYIKKKEKEQAIVE